MSEKKVEDNTGGIMITGVNFDNYHYPQDCPFKPAAIENHYTSPYCSRCIHEDSHIFNLFEDRKLEKMSDLYSLILTENARQISKWGVQKHTIHKWMTIVSEEHGELAKAIQDFERDVSTADDIVKEAIQTATLCLKIAEMFLFLKEKKEETNNE